MLPFIVRLYNVISNVTFQVLNSSYLSYLVTGVVAAVGFEPTHSKGLVTGVVAVLLEATHSHLGYTQLLV